MKLRALILALALLVPTAASADALKGDALAVVCNSEDKDLRDICYAYINGALHGLIYGSALETAARDSARPAMRCKRQITTKEASQLIAMAARRSQKVRDAFAINAVATAFDCGR